MGFTHVISGTDTFGNVLNCFAKQWEDVLADGPESTCPEMAGTERWGEHETGEAG